MMFLDRRQLVQALFDSLKDKSKVHTSSDAVKVELFDSHVTLETKDGRQFTGSIVVGADGIHSRVRDEMWRIANSEIPGYISERQQEALAKRYSRDVVYDGLTFGEIYKLRVCSALVPLEEFVLEKCFYKRLILCGDAHHKVMSHSSMDTSTSFTNYRPDPPNNGTWRKCCNRISRTPR
jgi:hypothetical protein